MESERGWGQRYEFWGDYDTLEKAMEAFERINMENAPGPAPDWYIIATEIQEFKEETGRWVKVY